MQYWVFALLRVSATETDNIEHPGAVDIPEVKDGDLYLDWDEREEVLHVVVLLLVGHEDPPGRVDLVRLKDAGRGLLPSMLHLARCLARSLLQPASTVGDDPADLLHVPELLEEEVDGVHGGLRGRGDRCSRAGLGQ